MGFIVHRYRVIATEKTYSSRGVFHAAALNRHIVAPIGIGVARELR
jgi:hypothetical protein